MVKSTVVIPNSLYKEFDKYCPRGDKSNLINVFIRAFTNEAKSREDPLFNQRIIKGMMKINFEEEAS